MVSIEPPRSPARSTIMEAREDSERGLFGLMEPSPLREDSMMGMSGIGEVLAGL